MDIERFRVRTDGAELACARFGSGPPLLCAHALAFSKDYFVEAAEVLGARFTCIAVDQRGHGETEGEVPEEPGPMADDLLAVLDHLGIARAAVGGISLGAATTLTLALRHPGRVDVLLQDLPAFGPESPRGGLSADQAAAALERGDFEAAARAASAGLAPVPARALARMLIAEWARYDPARLGPKLASAFRRTTRWRIVDDWPGALAGLDVRTEILGLVGDRSHPYEVASAMERALPRARLHDRVPTLKAAGVAAQWVEVLLLDSEP